MKLSKKEIIKILGNWDIGKIKGIKKAKLGLVNHNWLIQTDKGKFVLRGVSKDRKIKQLEFELNYLLKLQKKFNYKIPTPIPTKNNKYLVKVKNNNLWLYKFIEGKVLWQFDKPKLKKAAKMIADYHKVLEKLRMRHKKLSDPLLQKQLLNEANSNIKKIKKKKIISKADKIYLKEIIKLKTLIKNLKDKKCKKLKQYSIHRDLGPENILWKNNKISGVIDFENVGLNNDVLVKDLAIFMQRAITSDLGILNLKKARYFVKEYLKLKKLSKNEIELIPDFIIASFIDDANYSYWLIVNDPKRSKTKWIIENSNGARWFYNNRDKIIRGLK